MTLLNPGNNQPDLVQILADIGEYTVKSALKAEVSYGMAGRLYLSSSGWILLSVPNALVRGAFAALQEPGIELPPGPVGSAFNAHISVIRPEELETIGGSDVISERGHTFRYTLGKTRTVEPEGWPEISRVWLIEVNSPELQNLRKSYGLPPLPKHPFHITVAVRKKGILNNNGVKKD